MKEALQIGQTVETNGFRVHRYATSVTVVAVADAGKRGKRCRELRIRSSNQATLNIVADLIVGKIESGATDLEAFLHSYMLFTPGVVLDARDLRAVDVPFGGIIINGPKAYIDADSTQFTVRCKVDQANEPTLILQPGRKCAKQALTWFKANQKAIEDGITLRDISMGLASAGVATHYYCAVD